MDESLLNANTSEEKSDKNQARASSDTVDENPSLYYFESDHLALKGNPDYHNLLRCLAIAQAQKMKAIRDLEILYDKQELALKSPIEFVEKLQSQEDMGFPRPQNVAEIPDVDWEKYASSINLKLFQENKSKTRAGLVANEIESSGDPCPVTDIRGRPMTENKSSTFNRLWTTEEQKKLEDLLLKYPPQTVENRRWHKIATELGNRTTTQVASRVQKYFIKLAQAGLPVPGRIPNMNQHSRKATNKNRLMYMKHNYNPSTFFASLEPPVFMLEEDDSASSIRSLDAFNNEYSTTEDELIPSELKHSAEYRELMELKQMKDQILRKEDAYIEYKCDCCGMEPIVGSRWHCSDCPPEIAVDFCNECASSIQDNNIHDKSHRLDVISGQSISCLDSDYRRFPSSGSNYLDPNYMACT